MQPILPFNFIYARSFLLASISAGSSSFKSLNSNMSGLRKIALSSKFIFPIPFIGLIIFTASILEPSLGIPEQLGWVLMLAPGPLYVHLSYAPRWRMLDRMARGMAPMEGPIEVGKKSESEDQDMLDAIDEISEE